MLFTADIGNTRASLCLWDESTGRKEGFIILDNTQGKKNKKLIKQWFCALLKNKNIPNKCTQAKACGYQKFPRFSLNKGGSRGLWRQGGVPAAATFRLRNSKFPDTMTSVLISSVNPALEKIIISAARVAAGKIPGLKTGFRKISTQDVPLPMKYKGSCGLDRLLAAFGALKETGKNALIVNSGTACCIDLLENGVFCGGAILPGPETMLHSLNIMTAGIRVKTLKAAAFYPGRDTAECVSVGIRRGMFHLLKGFAADIRKRKKNMPVILTGGKSGMFPASLVPGAVHIPDLVHRGLFHLFPLIKNRPFPV